MRVDQPGGVTLVGGRYRLESVIGRGGMADVYRAVDERLGRTVAVKCLRDVVADGREEARARNEAQVLAGLSHPGLVTLFDAGVDDGRPYLVMELVEGPSLAVRPPRHLGDVAEVGAQVAGALAYVHARGLVHRDVKPANVLTCGPGGDGGPWSRVKLADFGIARLLDSTGITATGTTVGTAAYLAPEQVRGEPVGPAADIWSLGLILLECITGERAYPGSPAESAMARLHRRPEVPASLPEPWIALLGAMTATDPGARPAAAEVAVALSAMAASPGGPEGGTPTQTLWGPPVAPTAVAPAAPGAPGAPGAPATAVMASPPPRSHRWPDVVRRPWFRPAAVAASLLLVALIGVALVGTGHSSPSGPTGPSTTAPSTAASPATLPAPLPAPAVPGPAGRDLAALHKAVNP